nr:MAG TPA: hypothetical protein [Caudoviricetes sp.]DAO61879.1 MAG TPA: hypothetical protein [Caudoviricetes sp.]
MLNKLYLIYISGFSPTKGLIKYFLQRKLKNETLSKG